MNPNTQNFISLSVWKSFLKTYIKQYMNANQMVVREIKKINTIKRSLKQNYTKTVNSTN